MGIVKLKKGRDKSALRKHPWIFTGAVDKVIDVKQNGETVKVTSSDGKFLGYGSYSFYSQIVVRFLSFNEEDNIDISFFRSKILNAIEFRKGFINNAATNVYRIVNAEADSLPGLIVDKYNDVIVCQFLSAGAEFWKKEIVQIINDLFSPRLIYERSDVDVREKEGLKLVKGSFTGIEPEALVEVIENNNRFFVDIVNGHKTGFYIDQRKNRQALTGYVKDAEVLNCFSYTGGFSVYALNAGAKKVINVDASLEALNLAEKNIKLNHPSADNFVNVQEDVFKFLRRQRDEGKKFDVIILDPPKFAESVNQVNKASRGYKDINLLALKLLNDNGVLFTFSCSGHITTDLFNKIIADAALDSGRKVRVLDYLHQSPDHAVSTNFPESLYLKGLICKVN